MGSLAQWVYWRNGCIGANPEKEALFGDRLGSTRIPQGESSSLGFQPKKPIAIPSPSPGIHRLRAFHR